MIYIWLFSRTGHFLDLGDKVCQLSNMASSGLKKMLSQQFWTPKMCVWENVKFHNFNIWIWLVLLPYMQADVIALADVIAHDVVADVITLVDVVANFFMYYIFLADVITKGLYVHPFIYS